MFFDLLVKSLDVLADTIEYGSLKNSETPDQALLEFKIEIDKIYNLFCAESEPINLGLVYDYNEVNDYGKLIIEKVSSDVYIYVANKSIQQQRKVAEDFKEKCRQGCYDKYEFIFWAFIVLLVDDNELEKHLSLICKLISCLEISDEDVKNIIRLIRVVCQK